MNIKTLSASLDYLVQAELTPFLWGRAGIGKTSIVKQYAKAKGFKFFSLYLGTQSDIGDVLGLAEFIDNGDGSKSTAFATPKWLNDIIAHCNNNPDSGAIIFLDEFNRGRRDILAGMFSLALDKTFHTIKLPKNCHIIAAGNPPTDDYLGVTDINDTALMARFVHIKLDPTFDEWLEYANGIEMDHTLIGFLRNQPQLLEQASIDFQPPVKVDRRAFERLDKLFKIKTPTNLIHELMPGIIGLERTVAYMNYLKEHDAPLTAEEVLTGKKTELVKEWSNPENILSSYLNLSCENVAKHLETLNTETPTHLTPKERKNLFTFLILVPKDISYCLIDKLMRAQNQVFKEFTMDKKYAQELVDLALSVRGTK